MRTCIIVLALTSLLFVAGCLRSSTTILIKKNGTAVITDSLMLTPATMKMYQEMAKATNTPVDKLLREQWNDTSFYAAAKDMGPGVSTRSVKMVKTARGVGYVSIYDVENINELRISKNAFHDHMNSGSSTKPNEPSYVTFLRQDERVTIHNMPLKPEPKSDSAAPLTDADMKQQVQMLKEFMRDLEIAIRISFEPGIASTDATYATNNTVVITELKFNSVIAKFEKDPSIFRLMSGIPTPEPWSLEKAFNSLNTSVKMETKSTIQVSMR